MRRLLLACSLLTLPAAAQYTVSSSSPASVPAGSRDIILTLTGNFVPTGATGAPFQFCIYTPARSITGQISSAGTARLQILGSFWDIDPSNFTNGEMDAQVFVISGNASCGAPGPNDNPLTLPVLYPQITGASLYALPQPNPNVGVSFPNSVALNASSLNTGTGAQVHFDPSPDAATDEYVQLNSGDTINSVVTATIPQDLTAQANSIATASFSPCNTSASGTYTYCSPNSPTTIQYYPLATSSIAVNPNLTQAQTNQNIVFSAQLSSPTTTTFPTDGGQYQPTAPGGIVTFKENNTILGAAPALGTTLGLTATGSSFFQSSTQITSGAPGPFQTITADFNHDGAPDILLLETATQTLHLFLGGSPIGNFQNENLLSLGQGCTSLNSIAAGDLNGDHIPDLAFLCGSPNGGSTLTVAYGLGDGNFGTPTTIATVFGDQVAIGNVDTDGNLDLIVTGATSPGTSPSYGILTFLNSGNGTGIFNAGPTTVTPDNPGTKLVAKDLNADRADDLVLVHQNASGVTAVQPYQNNGSGTFTAVQPLTLCNCNNAVSKLFVTPLTANNKFPDIEVALTGAGFHHTASLMNTAQAAISFANSGLVSQPNMVDAVVGDFNGDGIADLATYDGTTVNVLTNDGTGVFPSNSTSQTLTFTNLLLAAAVDLNVDGFADLVGLQSGQGSPEIDSYLTTGTTTASLSISFGQPGPHTVTAVYQGDPALLGNSGQTTVTITAPPSPTVSLAISPNPVTYGQSPKLIATVSSAAGTPTGQVTFVDSTTQTTVGTGTIANGTTSVTYVLPTAGNHSIATTYNGDPNFSPGSAPTGTLTVNPAVPTIAWTPPSTVPQGSALSATQLNATASGVTASGLPGVFTYTPAAGFVPPSGPLTLQVSFAPTDSTNYTTASASRNVQVSPASTTTTLTGSPNPASVQSSVTFTATITQVGTVASGQTPPSGTVLFYDGQTQLGSGAVQSGHASFATSALTAGTHSITAVYGGDSLFNGSGSSAYSETINTITPQITWNPTPTTITYGTALVASQLNATTSPAQGTFTYTPALGAILDAGTQTLRVDFAPSDTNTYQATFTTTSILVQKQTPTIAWPSTSPIIAGTPLSSTQLNAVAKDASGNVVNGSYVYTPAAGSVLGVGNTPLNVSFTPANTTDYNPATGSVPITVLPATTTTITLTPNPVIVNTPVTITAAVTSTTQGVPSGSITFLDQTTQATIATVPLTQGSASTPYSPATVGPHKIAALYSGDQVFGASTATPATLTVNPVVVTPVITWNPAVPSIAYGTPLSGSQLNATTTTPGTFVYTPALGAILPPGQAKLSVVFTPADTLNFSSATQTAAITVTRATPTVTFPTPADVIVGTPLSATQLTATATGIIGAPLPGTFVFTPAAGTLVTSGAQPLTVLFTPTDLTNYTTQTVSTTLNGIPVTLTALSSTTASLGDPAKTITLTGTGFAADSVVRSNGTALATTFVNATTLQAVLPASSFTVAATLQLTVFNPTQLQTSNARTLTVSAPAVTVSVTAPSTSTPTGQPTLSLRLTNPYPVPISGTFTITFQSGTKDKADDPNIVFADTGTRTYPFTVATGQVIVPSIAIQSGTVAGTIVITLNLTAGGIDVTPTGTTPTTISIAPVVPGITSLSATRGTRQITINTIGYSNTRDITTATFHFTPAAGKQIQTQNFTIDVSTLFATWYATPASLAFGSSFLYTQTFTLDDDVSVIGSITVTLSNGQGPSPSGNTQ